VGGQVIEEVVSASRALAAAGLSDMYAVLLERACRTQLTAQAAGHPVVWWDPAEAGLKREQVWNHGQRQAGWQYLLRSAGRVLPS